MCPLIFLIRLGDYVSEDYGVINDKFKSIEELKLEDSLLRLKTDESKLEDSVGDPKHVSIIESLNLALIGCLTLLSLIINK